MEVPMNNKKQTGDFGLGDVIVPIIDLFSEVLIKISQLSVNGLHFGLSKYVFKSDSRDSIKKIERDNIGNNRRTLLDEAIGYSTTSKRNILGSEVNKSAHTAIVGASGSGKSVLIDALIFEDMRQGKPVVYLDPKGDNGSLLNFINLCKLTGRDFYIFSDYWNGEGACHLNPVKDGSSTNIADRVFKSFTWSEEHYAQICRDALEDAVSILKNQDELVSIESIYNKVLEISDSKKKNESLYKRDDIQGILSRIKKIMRSEFGERLNSAEGLSFSDIRKSNKCVYIGLSVLGFAEIARSLGKIIMGDISYSAYDSYKKITPDNSDNLTKMGLYIDELSAIINDEFIEILNKVRGAKLELTFAFQSPSDIAKIDPELCTQVLENTSNWFLFKQRLKQSAEMLAESIGTMESKKQTLRIQDGEEMSQGSQRIVEEMIVHSNILKNLNVGQCVFLRHYPTKVDLLNVKYISPTVLWNNVKYLNKEVNVKVEKASRKKKRSLLTEDI
jgi:type IV secretory pathway VirB4 component